MNIITTASLLESVSNLALRSGVLDQASMPMKCGGEDHGDEYGELGQEFWADVHSLEDAKATVDALVTDLETREVA